MVVAESNRVERASDVVDPSGIDGDRAGDVRHSPNGRPWCIFGSRGVARQEAIDRLTAFADEHGHPSELLCGCAPGADTWGREWVRSEVRIARILLFPADWKQHGRAAGPIRNAEMAKALHEAGGIGVALWDGQSRGTLDMMGRLQALGVKGHVLLVTP